MRAQDIVWIVHRNVWFHRFYSQTRMSEKQFEYLKQIAQLINIKFEFANLRKLIVYKDQIFKKNQIQTKFLIFKQWTS